MRIFVSTITRYLLIILCLCSIGLSRDDNPSSMAKPATVELELFTGNNISNWIGNHGHLTSHWASGNSGCEWPAGSGNTAIFASGIWVAGQVDGEIRSAAVEYASEWTPGIIPYDTQTQLPTSDTPLNTADHQIYYIQQIESFDLLSVPTTREYNTWPSSDGAPARDGEYFTDLNSNSVWDSGERFEDFDGDGSYDAADGLLVTGEDPPLFLGDTQAWYVMNDWDTTSHNNLWNTAPLGLEAQVLIYTRSDDPIYENVQFHTVTLINKGGQPIADTYYAYWSDCDIGNANDDYAGCDTSLSLGYSYNGLATDRDYGLIPPAVGYDFLQGPMVESIGDTVWYNEVAFPQRRTLGMTAFELFVSGSSDLDDPELPFEAYNYMQGRQGQTGDQFVDPSGNLTTYLYSGDPATRSGWTQFDDSPVGDRRTLMSSGPFDLPPWDDINNNGRADFGEPGVQIIHSALIIVDGADHVNAVTNLKYVSRYTQDDFDNGFETYSMEKPQLSSSGYDQEIVLDWYEGADEYEAITFGSYEFEGYNLYQGASAAGPWTRLATFDIPNQVGVIGDQQYDDTGYLQTVAVQWGSDTGLQHLISIQEDVLNDDEPLTNNKAYYFALSAYAYDAEALPKTLETEKRIISVRPHINRDGAAPRDTLIMNRPEGGEVIISIEVQDPIQLTGLDYEIGFEYDSSSSLGRWHLLRGGVFSTDTLYRSEQFENLRRNWQWRSRSYQNEAERYYFDGFELSIIDIDFQTPKYSNGWEQTIDLEGSTFETLELLAVSPGGVDLLAWSDESMIEMVNIDTLFGSDFYYDKYEREERGEETWFILNRENLHRIYVQAHGSGFGGQGGDRLADIPGIGGGSTNLEFLQADLEIRFTEAGQNASLYAAASGYIPVLTHIPYEVWDIERNIQLCVGINDNNRSGGNQDTTKEDWEHTLDLDWVIIFDRDYEIYGSEVDSLFNNPYSGWIWQFSLASKFSIGDVVSFYHLNPVKAGSDVYRWSTDVAGMTYDEDALDMIQVFPNPYFGYQSEQSSFSEPFVTFSNLPEQECTIRIYSLGGSLVRRFDHEVGTYEYWDLLNQHGSPIASGVYIVHIEVPDLGNKILKVAVFQPER
ncbi:MAG: T9SS type A sorting domain-containing protein [Candidatus Marinimicrobia bacterium]|nr:T9SS type A sorting domain-containing protein [Candidatus Neomarinimicrobiota bacterium]